MDFLNSLFGPRSTGSSSNGVDKDAYLAASRAISIIFIFLVIIVNASLIFKNVRKCDFYLKAKNQTIISLAIADLFFALFSLTAVAKSYFEAKWPQDVYCNIGWTPVLYQRCLLNFVYAAGLMSLAIELLRRHRLSPQAEGRVKRVLVPLLFSAGPWLFGVVIILPICSVSFSSELSCNSQGTAGVVVSVILPACFAVILCVVINCRVLPTAQHQQPAATQVVAMTTVSTTSTIQHPQGPAMYPGPPPANGNGYPAYLTPRPSFPPPGPQNQQLGNPNVIDQQPDNPYVNLPSDDQRSFNPPATQPISDQQHHDIPAQQQPRVGQPTYTHPAFQQPNSVVLAQPVLITVQSGAMNAQPAVVAPTTNLEKTRLMSMSICFLFHVLPYAIFQISYENDATPIAILDGVSYTAIRDLVMWFMVLRSFMIPAMMYGYSDT